jgi:hypothetical protein
LFPRALGLSLSLKEEEAKELVLDNLKFGMVKTSPKDLRTLWKFLDGTFWIFDFTCNSKRLRLVLILV